jgi:predicted aspartyl protease
MKAMIDTGANRTFVSLQALSTSYSQQFINRKQRSAFLADGHTSISILGTLDLHIVIGDMLTSIKAYVVKDLCAECILGMDFISKYKVIINADERVVSICDHEKRLTLQFDVNQDNSLYLHPTTRNSFNSSQHWNIIS